MDKNYKKYYITLSVICILSLLLIFVIWSFSDRSRVAFNCSINNIDYIDVSPLDCWIDEINSTYCPLPKDIYCSGEVSGLANLMLNAIGDLYE